jgi:arginyl-tRNA synthetase
MSQGAYARQARQSQPMGWLGHFTATFAGALLAGILLLVGVRTYIHWSVADAGRQIEAGIKEFKDQQQKTGR